MNEPLGFAGEAELPDALRSRIAALLLKLREGAGGMPPGDTARAFAASEFLRESLERHAELLEYFAAPGVLDAAFDRASYAATLGRRVHRAASEAELMACLRSERRREMVRIAWRDLAGLASVEQTLSDLTAIAEVLTDAALARVYEWQCERHGTPRSPAGAPQRLVVVALGKLGSFELNFSSDIDLIFAYPEGGETDGSARPVANEQFFARVAQRLIHVLSERTEDGFVFRVDMRLRPFGTSGALAASFDQLEQYYQSYGRDWERFAFIRARAVAGDLEAGAELLATLRPFVYRRYLDFGALESLREIKTQIAHDLRGKRNDPDEDDIKRGWGGIRELEFVVQAFQLLRGAAFPELQSGAILTLLPVLGDLGLLGREACDELGSAYRFLRTLENRLQCAQDQQTHTLPQRAAERSSLAIAMGYPSWPALSEATVEQRRRVRAQFELVLGDPKPEPPEGADPTGLFLQAWAAISDSDAAARLLGEGGLDDAPALAQRLLGLKQNYRLRTLSDRGQRRVATLVGAVLGEIASYPAPLETLIRTLQVIEGILQRTAYLALLTERPVACRQLVRLCAASPWLAQHLATHPQTFDELLDPRTLYMPPQRAELQEALAERLQPIPAGDEELEANELRYFQQANVLRVAAAEIAGAIPLMVVSDRLTDIAEICVGQVLEFAWRDLTARFGEPTFREGDGVRVAPFAIVAYGKLGGIELSYGSDLDLVFLHGSTGEEQMTNGSRVIDNATFFARLGQRIIHYLSTYTGAGRLYEVDPRLRPSGSAGLLVSSINAFDQYQKHDAWTWEHQALVRARSVAGDGALAERFATVRREVLLMERDREALRGEVREMRVRMQSELGAQSATAFNLKQDPGGIADIEFLVQYATLAWADELGDHLRFTDNIRLLDGFEQCGVATAEQAAFLRDAYRAYRARVHELDLQELPAVVSSDEFVETREAVRALWKEWMEGAADGPQASEPGTR